MLRLRHTCKWLIDKDIMRGDRKSLISLRLLIVGMMLDENGSHLKSLISLRL